MNAFDCYAIADALLAGNQTSRWVLVDWLSDLGDIEEANFIRRASASRAGDLDVAIRQIPCPHVVELGVDFLEHCADWTQAGLQSLLERIRRMLKRGGSAEQFAAASRSLAEYHSAKRDWYYVELEALDDAVHSLSAAVEAAGAERDCPRAAAVAVTATARLIRAPNLAGLRGKKRPNQLNWQIKRTRELLGQLAMQGG
jgi:hypothetical protein